MLRIWPGRLPAYSDPHSDHLELYKEIGYRLVDSIFHRMRVIGENTDLHVPRPVLIAGPTFEVPDPGHLRGTLVSMNEDRTEDYFSNRDLSVEVIGFVVATRKAYTL